MKKNTYKHLAAHMDLHYLPVYSWELLPLNRSEFYGVELMGEQVRSGSFSCPLDSCLR